MRWEYRIYLQGDNSKIVDVLAALNELGDLEWELVTTIQMLYEDEFDRDSDRTQHTGPSGIMHVFKRANA